MNKKILLILGIISLLLMSSLTGCIDNNNDGIDNDNDNDGIIIEQTRVDGRSQSSSNWQNFNSKNMQHIDKIELLLGTSNNDVVVTVSIDDETVSKIVNTPFSAEWVTFDFDYDISKNTEYKILLTGTVWWLRSQNDNYPYGHSSLHIDYDFCFRVTGW